MTLVSKMDHDKLQVIKVGYYNINEDDDEVFEEIEFSDMQDFAEFFMFEDLHDITTLATCDEDEDILLVASRDFFERRPDMFYEDESIIIGKSL